MGPALAARLRGLRAERGLTLDELAARSGVSRSAISLVERAEASPTAAVLDKLAAALDVPLASLFDPLPPAPSPLSRRADQARWRDPQTGYLRRNVSAPGWPSPVRIVEVELPPGATVAYEDAHRASTVHQQVWVLAGRLDVAVGNASHQLRKGDCLAMRVEGPTSFANPTARPARYAVVVATEPHPGRERAR